MPFWRKTRRLRLLIIVRQIVFQQHKPRLARLTAGLGKFQRLLESICHNQLFRREPSLQHSLANGLRLTGVDQRRVIAVLSGLFAKFVVQLKFLSPSSTMPGVTKIRRPWHMESVRRAASAPLGLEL